MFSGSVWLFCNPMDCSLPGSSTRGISQVTILELVAISFSRGFFWPRDQTLISCVSCIGRWVLHHCNTWEAPFTTMKNFKYCRCLVSLGYEARLKVRACQVLHTRAVSLCLLQPSDFPFLQFPQEVTCFLEKLNPSISEFRIREAQYKSRCSAILETGRLSWKYCVQSPSLTQILTYSQTGLWRVHLRRKCWWEYKIIQTLCEILW